MQAPEGEGGGFIKPMWKMKSLSTEQDSGRIDEEKSRKLLGRKKANEKRREKLSFNVPCGRTGSTAAGKRQHTHTHTHLKM